MIRIIDDKQIELTADEWNIYNDIITRYTTATMEGKYLFRGLFESDDKGIIQTLKPPQQAISMEIFLFMSCVMQHQHIRLMYQQLQEWKSQFEQQSSAHMERLVDTLKPKAEVVEPLPLHTPLPTTAPSIKHKRR
jgi:hypothetical protein